MKDREQVVRMLTCVKDQFALSVYKKVYNINDSEIMAERKELEKVQKTKEK